MDPRYMDFGEVDSSKIAPLQHKKNYGIRVGPDLYRSVSVQCCCSSLVGGGGGGGGGESVVW